MKRLIAALSLVAVLISQTSHAFSVTALGGLNWSNPSQTTTSTTRTITNSSATGTALGAMISLSAFPGFAAETGALYLSNKYKNVITFTGGTVDNTISSKAYHFPVLLRFVALPFVSAGGGLFYEVGTGDIDATDAVSSTSSTTTYAASGISNKNYGLVFDLRGNLPLAPALSLVVDYRYHLGLKNLGLTSTGEFKTRNMLLMAGISLGFE